MSRTVLNWLAGGMALLLIAAPLQAHHNIAGKFDPSKTKTLKGIVTGALAGLIARRKQSLWLGLLAGLVIGFILSSLAAMGQPAHYWEIVFPGMVLGLIVGFVTQRYPQGVKATSASLSVPSVCFCWRCCRPASWEANGLKLRRRTIRSRRLLPWWDGGLARLKDSPARAPSNASTRGSWARGSCR